MRGTGRVGGIRRRAYARTVTRRSRTSVLRSVTCSGRAPRRGHRTQVARTGRGSTTTSTRSGRGSASTSSSPLLAVGSACCSRSRSRSLAHRYRRLCGPTLASPGSSTRSRRSRCSRCCSRTPGLSRATAIIPLTAYTLLILVRNIVAGLDGVPGRRARGRGRAWGTRGARRLLRSSCRSRCRRSWPGSASRR